MNIDCVSKLFARLYQKVKGQSHLAEKSIVQNVCTKTKPGIERVQALAYVSRSRYVVIVTKTVRRLQIRPIVHN